MSIPPSYPMMPHCATICYITASALLFQASFGVYRDVHDGCDRGRIPRYSRGLAEYKDYHRTMLGHFLAEGSAANYSEDGIPSPGDASI